MSVARGSSLSVVLLSSNPAPTYASCLADARISYVAKFSQAWRHWRPRDMPNDNCYISNRRRFAKSTFRVSLLSTVRVSRINYSLVCSLPIHTWSSADGDGPPAHCQLNTCKMLHKCSTDRIWKGLQPLNDLESHSRSPPLLPFERPYTISY